MSCYQGHCWKILEAGLLNNKLVGTKAVEGMVVDVVLSVAGLLPSSTMLGLPSISSKAGGTQQQQPRGSPPQRRGGDMGGGGRGGVVPSSGGLSRPSVPELHQATQAPDQAGVMTHPMPYVKPEEVVQCDASSSSVPEPTLEVMKQFQHHSVQQEPSSSDLVQLNPASSKSLRFPLRPGKGSTGSRCIVKANHFFAELPD